MCDEAEIYNEKIVTARKEYKCCECRNTIAVGEKHWKCDGLWDREFLTYRDHSYCHAFRNFLNDSRWPSGWEMCFEPPTNYGRLKLQDEWYGDMDTLVLWNKQIRRREGYRDPEERIPFGGIKEYLFECNGKEELRWWNGMMSGINETFLKGEGI